MHQGFAFGAVVGRDFLERDLLRVETKQAVLDCCRRRDAKVVTTWVHCSRSLATSSMS